MNIVGRVTRNRNSARFGWMFVLTVTACSRYEMPAVASEKLKYITNLHSAQMIGELVRSGAMTCSMAFCKKRKPGNSLH